MSEALINKNDTLKRLAIEYFALTPSCTCKEVSEKLNIPLRTLSSWRADPDFGDAVYKRAMVEFGLELPAIMKSIFHEGKNGNVQAQRLILEHFGKLTKNSVNIIISPFEQFLESNDNNGMTEVHLEDAPVIDVDDIEIEVTKENPNRKGRVKEEKAKNFKQMQKELAKKKRNLKQKEWYRWKKRAKAVGIEPMKGRRPTPIQRKEWEQSIIDKESELRDSE